MLSWGLILLGTVAWLAAAQPIQSDASPQWMLRERRSPMAARTMILIRGQPTGGGYHYELPVRAFKPHAAKLEQPDAPQPEEEKSEPETPEEEEALAEVDASKEAAEPNRNPKAPKRRPSEEEEDEDEDSVPRKGGRPGGSVYRNFFPMTFGVSPRDARDAAGGEGNHGAVRTIANSFSTGRGAVASSSAKAYGKPSASGQTDEPNQTAME